MVFGLYVQLHDVNIRCLLRLIRRQAGDCERVKLCIYTVEAEWLER